MLKKLLLTTAFTTVAFASDIYNTFPTDKEAFAFKKGFQLAIMSLKDGREYKLQGKDESEVKLKDHIVFIDSTDMDDSDKMAVQKIGFIYSESVRLNDNRIAIASFSSKANAITLAKTLNRTYFNKNAPHRRAYVYEKKGSDVFFREKSIAFEIANILEEELRNEMKVIYIKDNKKAINKPVSQKVATPPSSVQKNTQANMQISNSKKTAQNQQINKEQSKSVTPTINKKESHINKEPFFIQFIPKGKFVVNYKLIKDINNKNINSSDLIKQSQIENDGELLLADNYIITTDDKKFIKAQNGFFYKEDQIEVINDFTKE